MPEFILPKDGVVENAPAQCVFHWDDLSPFVQGYIQAMFFTNTGSGDSVEWATPEYQERMVEGQTDGELPNDVGFADIHPDTLGMIIADCSDFQRDNAALLEAAYASEGPRMSYGPENAGMDFWYNTVGHGVGFWDRNLGEIGDALDEACKRQELNPYYDPETGKVCI